MYDRFQPARVPAGMVFDVRFMVTVASPAATFIRGALVVSTAGLIDTCGADPATITGVALADANSAPGFSAANSPATFTGRTQSVAVAAANAVTIFSGYGTNGSSTRVQFAQADTLVSVGVTAYSSIWTVDKNKTAGSARVSPVDIDLDNSGVFFRVLPANYVA